MIVFVLLIWGLQYFGGAYQAEYDGQADEAAHVVSSLLVRDYLAQFPWPSPIPWAMDYYLHYPKVAIGHWPPGYYVIQGVWWLVFPPGRESAMALNLLMGAAVMTLFWVLGRRLADPWPVVAGAGIVMLLLPVVQEALSQVMAELPSLLAATIFLWALTRVQENPGRQTLVVLWLALLAGFAIKQTSVGLAAAPVIALTLSGAWRRLPRGPMLVWPVLAAVAVGLLLSWQYAGSISQMLRWSGMAGGFDLKSSFPQLLSVVGVAIAGLAVAGALVAWQRRDPLLIASVAIVLSFALCSFFIRAFREPRHWIALVPPMLMLAMAAYGSLAERTRWAPVLLLAVVFSAPHRFYRQSAAGYAELAAQIRQPARMLISSSSGWPEGPWIANAALREARPSSVIVRATKLLASSDWNAKRYVSKVSSTEDVERALDGAGIDLVVTHDDLTHGGEMLHHTLLRSVVTAAPGWRRCAGAGSLVAFCRQLPPRYPRLPLRMNLDRMGLGSFRETP